MDFFGAQDNSKKQSALLLIAFVIALLCTGAFIHFASAFIVSLLSGEVQFTDLSRPTTLFVGLMWATCIAGVFFRFLDIKAGGSALAVRFGGSPASERNRHSGESTLLNVVAEVSIASSTPAPAVFVIRNQPSINAFVVGGFKGKEALVVSQGALDSLDRDQLQAVVAHEFGHIAQGDIPLNMHMLLALGGLNAIDEVGQLLIGKGDDRIFNPGTIVGYFMRVIGSVGVYSGRILRAAFSRQREFLADASGVQFTRRPDAMAGALTIIRDEGLLYDAVPSVHAEEIAHLCFQSNTYSRWLSRWFATHPPIQKRIDAIDPHFDIKSNARVRADIGSSAGVSQMPDTLPMSREIGIEPDGVLSDKMMLFLGDSSACLAVLHALFVSEDTAAREKYYKAIGFAYNKLFSNQVRELQGNLKQELNTQQLPIIDHACTQLLNDIKFSSRQRIVQSLEKLLMVEGEFNLMNYAALQLIRQRLGVEFPLLVTVDGDSVAQASQSKPFDTMGREFALLLSLLVEASKQDEATMNKEFSLALKCYTTEQFPRRTQLEPGIVKEMEKAFQCLYVQPQAVKDGFVEHCVEISRRDGHIAKAEQALLDLFAASLGCDRIAA